MVFCCRAHLLQGLTCCAFREGILHTLVVPSHHFSWCCLSFISSPFAHSPLTSTKHFFYNCCSLDIFTFKPFSETLNMVVCENLSGWTCFEILRPACLAPKSYHVQIHSNPYSDSRFELQQVVFTRSRCLNALTYCHVIGWFAICISKNWTGALNKRPSECIQVSCISSRYSIPQLMKTEILCAQSMSRSCKK